MTLRAVYDPSKTDAAFAARDADGLWWNGTAFESFNAANYVTYQITATETPADSGLYEGTEPTGTVEFELRIKAGTWATSYVVAGPQEAETTSVAQQILDEVVKIDRAAAPTTPGAPQVMRLVNEANETLKTAHQVLDGDA